MAVQVSVKIEDARALAQMKAARRDLNGKMRAALKLAGEKVALPSARRRVGYKVEGVPVATTLVVKSTSRSAYLTTSLRGKKGRAVGLLEFGGTVRTAIEPKNAKALTIGTGGVIRANVTRPRVYRGLGSIQEAVHSQRARIDDTIRDEILEVFTPEFEVT